MTHKPILLIGCSLLLAVVLAPRTRISVNSDAGVSRNSIDSLDGPQVWPSLHETAAPQDPLGDPSCYYIGCSACGGDDRHQCSASERYCSWRCSDGVHNGCRHDKYCEKTK